MTSAARSNLSHLERSECGKKFNADQLQTDCLDYRSHLYAQYELLPDIHPANRLTPGEGDLSLLFASPRIDQDWTRPGGEFEILDTGSGLKYV
jgi:hypothetical protein